MSKLSRLLSRPHEGELWEEPPKLIRFRPLVGLIGSEEECNYESHSIHNLGLMPEVKLQRRL